MDTSTSANLANSNGLPLEFEEMLFEVRKGFGRWLVLALGADEKVTTDGKVTMDG